MSTERREKDRRSAGFTVTEMLAAVAILTILLALGVPRLVRLRKELRQKELDSKAEILYTAAQNQLSKLRAAGREESYLLLPGVSNGVERLGFIPMDSTGENVDEDTVCYVFAPSDAPAAEAILPEGSADGELLSNSWVVEYKPESASVYAVFYSEEDIDYGSERERMNTLRYLNTRLKDGARVGYYGGDLVDVDVTARLDPHIVIHNGERLTAELRCVRLGGDESSSGLTFTVTLEDGAGHKVETTLTGMDVVPFAANYEYEMVLDDLGSMEGRFHQRFPTLEAGTPLSITLRAVSRNPLVEEGSVTVVTNGLFADESTGSLAVIRCGRHLQNLDGGSGVSEKITAARQMQDISFYDDPDREDDWHDLYTHGYYYYENGGSAHAGEDVFVPICNPALTLYDGSYTAVRDGEETRVCTTIYGLNTVRDRTDAGLFGRITGDMTLSSIRLSGATAISAAGTGSSAGALAGRIDGGVSMTSCQVFLTAGKGELTDQTDSDERIGAENCGGLAGCVSSTGYLRAENCFAATVLGGENSLSGGLVGSCEGMASFRGSYADCYVSGSCAGGLVGRASHSVTVTDCYAAGYLSGEDEVAGLVGGAAQMKNSYTACLFEGEGRSSSTAVSGSGEKVYYLSAGERDVTGTTSVSYGTLSDLTAMASALGSAFTGETGGFTAPYNLRDQGLTDYSFPRLAALRHYGDWEAKFEAGRMVYYEKYVDEDGRVSYGFYGANADLLKEDETITGDGYGLILSPDDKGSYFVFYNDANGKMITKGDKLNVNQNVRYPVEYAGQTYYIIPFQTAAVNTRYASPGFYQKIVYSRSNNPTDGEVYWYNPHFACAMISSAGDTAPALTEDTPIILRTARHLHDLSLYYDIYAEVTERNEFTQEHDIDYASYDWAAFGGCADVSVQEPVGRSTALPFAARYNGLCHTIAGVGFTSAGEYVGLFGVNAGTVTDTVLLGSGSAVTRSGVLRGGSAAIGTLAGRNDGIIRNCASAGYAASADTYENSTLALGGLVGVNNGLITRSSVEIPSLTLNNNRAVSAVGGFAGENNGSITESYAIAAARVVSDQGSSKLSGFAGSNDRGSITACYCASALTGSGTVTTYGFAPYSAVRDCEYLDQGAYTYAGMFRSYNNTNPATSGTAARYETLNAGGSGTAAYAHPHIAEGSRYTFAPRVRDRSGQFVHYGDWPEDPGLGTLGVFYWEHETEGANNGYRLSLVGTSNNVVQYSSNLCVAHDDGGNIAEYGYGYYYDRSSMTADQVKLTVSGSTAVSALSVNAEAKRALEQQLPYYELVPYTSGSEGGKLCLTGSDPNAVWTLSFKDNSYSYTLSPFFANAMCYNGVGKDRAGLYGEVPGTSAHPYEIRSVAQLQFINWNSETKSTSAWEDASTYRSFPYLAHATVTGQGKQSRSGVGGDFFWEQSHDLQGARFTGFTPIAAQGTTSGASSWDAVLYGWFGGSYDGGTFSIRDLCIDSEAYTVGLFGTTCGAQMENIVLYGENGSAFVRRSGNRTGAYALGGLIGVAYDYSSSSGREITNCAIAGYHVMDCSTGRQTQGEANVGGLIGVADVNLNGCSAVTDVEINATHTSGHATYGDYIRVGGVTGANKDTIRNCYSGGSITVGAATLAENCSSSGQQLPGNSSTAVSRERSTNIYIGGISGSGFTSNYKNFTGSGGQSDGRPHFVNCYTYLTFPRLEGTIRAISVIGSVADRYMGKAALTIENCYYLESCVDAVTKPATEERYHFTNNRYITDADVSNMLKGNLAFLREYIPTYNIGTPTYSIALTGVAYGELPNAALGGAFSPVTVVENGAYINGKYSYPAGVASLAGSNYPFRTVLTQTDRITGAPVSVHYGRWPLSSLIWDRGQVSMDLLRDMDTDPASPGCGWAETELTLSYEGVAPVGGELSFLYNGERSSEIAEILSQEYDPSDGSFKVVLRAKSAGYLTLTASDGKYSGSCDVEITAKLCVTADPAELEMCFYDDELKDSGKVTLKAASEERSDGSVNELTAAAEWAVRDFGDRAVTYTQPGSGKNEFTVTAEQLGTQPLRVDCTVDYHGFPCTGSAFVQTRVSLPGKVGLSNCGNVSDWSRRNWNEAYVILSAKTVNGRNVGYAGVLPEFGKGLPFVYLSRDVAEDVTIERVTVGEECVLQKGALVPEAEKYLLFPPETAADDTLGMVYRGLRIYALGGSEEKNVPLNVTLKGGKATYVLNTLIDIPAGTVHCARFYDEPDGNCMEKETWIVEQLPEGGATVPVTLVRERDDEAKHRHFIGWKEEGSGREYILLGQDGGSAELSAGEDHTFTAIWKNCFKITFDKNCADASVTAPAPRYAYAKYNGADRDVRISLPTLSDRADHRFMGWRVKGTGAILPMADYLPAGDVTLEAVWRPLYTVTVVSEQPVTVRYDGTDYAVGGLGEHSISFLVPEGESVTLADGRNAVTYYRFDGWYRDGSSAPAFSGGGSAAVTENVTWTAKWTRYPAVRLYGNGGEPDETTVRVEPDSRYAAVNAAWPEPGRTGYFFDGWAFDAAGSERVGESYAFTKDETLYAVWVKSITVRFDPNGGAFTGAATIEFADRQPGLTVSSLKNRPTGASVARPGYTFLGWADTSAASTPNVNDATVLRRSTTLYAVWQKNYVVSFSDESGTLSPPSREIVPGSSAGALPYGSREGYRLLGWAADSAGMNMVGDYFVPTGDITLYAQWQKLCTVTFRAGSSTFYVLSDVYGTVPYGSSTYVMRDLVPGTTFGDIKGTAPFAKKSISGRNQKQIGWSAEGENGALLSDSVPVTDGMTVYPVMRDCPRVTFNFMWHHEMVTSILPYRTKWVDSEQTARKLVFYLNDVPYSVDLTESGLLGQLGKTSYTITSDLVEGDRVMLVSAGEWLTVDYWIIDGVEYPLGSAYVVQGTGDITITGWNDDSR